MNKTIFKVLALMLLVMVAFSGCSPNGNGNIDDDASPKIEDNTGQGAAGNGSEEDLSQNAAGTDGDTASGDNILVEKSFGSYQIPSGWSELTGVSTPTKPFYVKDGIDLSTPTSNISIEVGANSYAASDHMSFRASILQMLGMQAADDVENITGSGSNTDSGDILYTFTIESPDIDSIQYYIVGDYKFCLVFVTDFKDERIPEVNEVALTMVNTFKWAE